ncbi:hypothetical protein Tco_0070957 [Tanacetum coccineum]
MVKKGKNFSRKVTPLFDSMLVQHTEDEGDASKRPSDSPPIPSPPYLSEDQPQIQLDLSPRPSPTTHIYDSIPEGSGRNHGGQSSNDASLSGNEDGLTLQSVYDLCVSLCKQVTAQAKEIKALKAQVKKLKKGVKPLIIHHKDWMKTRLSKKTSLKKKGVHKEYVSKQGRKSVKSFKDEGRTSYVVLEEKESANEGVSTEAPVSTDKQYEGTDKKNDGTDKQDRGTDSTKVSTDRQGEVRTRRSSRKRKKGVEIRNIAPFGGVTRVVNEEDTTKVLAKQEATEQGTKKRKSFHMKMIARKRPRPQPDDDSDDEHRKCLRIITFESTIDSEIMETKSFIARLHKVSSPDGNYLVVYRVNGHFRAFNYLMEVLHIFDRQDLFHLYDLVMKQYSEITPEDIELILWGDLKIMMESSTEENDQELKDGTVIYMLVERRYPLSKELLQQMIDLGLEVEEESTTALQLITMLNRHNNWLVHKQTAYGKDFSNPFMVDNLPKIVGFSTYLASQLSIHLVVYNEELAIPEQTATGKGISNPLMAGSLPKLQSQLSWMLLRRYVADKNG